MSTPYYLTEFTQEMTTRFSEFLSGYGFSLSDQSITGGIFGASSFTFTKGTQRIKTSLSFHPHDYGDGIYVSFAEGDNFTVSLRFVISSLTGLAPDLYICQGKGVAFAVSRVIEDLVQYFNDFLTGDIQTYNIFAAVRRGQ